MGCFMCDLPWCGFAVIAALIMALRCYMQGGKYRKSTTALDKVIIVTGCNTGIGKETVRELAKRGGKVYMACRDVQKCKQARLELIQDTGNKNIFSEKLDLASLKSIKEFAERFLAKETRLDVLINNAGVMHCPYMKTEDGFEMQLGVNHIGHFYLTSLLLPLLKQSAPSRIVVVSSLAHAIRSRISKTDLLSEGSAVA